jgi:hypothetical protein
MAALRTLRNAPAPPNYERLHGILRHFIPKWPVHGSYFPLVECAIGLDEIAYCNLVRCRTVENRTPPEKVATACAERHFSRWLELLQPCVVVFIGKWAHDRGRHHVRTRGVPFGFINRHRSLSREARAANRGEVVELVKRALSTL